MKNDILWKLYSGQYCPAEEDFNRLPAYAEASQKLHQKHNELEKLLGSDGILQVDEWLESYIALSNMESYCTFLRGFQLGIRLMCIGMQEEIELPEEE